MPRALVTGLTGQDGTLLAANLLSAGWEVHGSIRSTAESSADPRVVLHEADFSLPSTVEYLIEASEPDVVFNLAGLSSVAASWEQPVLSANVNAVSALTLLESAFSYRERTERNLRFVQASSGEIFGDATETPQTELTRVCPTSPYGAAKAYADSMVRMYRRRGLEASSAILFNHESLIRPATFVTRKITQGVAEISLGLRDKLLLGSLDVRRDWGWAPDYVSALQLIASSDEPDDFVVASGVSHSVREFVGSAFSAVGIVDWEGLVELDARYLRPADAADKRGDPSKIRDTLGWEPTVSFSEMIALMVAEDVKQSQL